MRLPVARSFTRSMSNVFSLEQARQLDRDDPLQHFRDQFHLPHEDGRQDIYFVGNSLGLQPKSVTKYVAEELETWRRLGVRGHFAPPRPWLNYHELLTETMAELVGGQTNEVIVMNTLTVNLHLMMATFYRPDARRNKILIEAHAFPSDKNAVESQIQLHGFTPAECLIELRADEGELFSTTAVIQAIRENHDSLALVLLPGVQYYTGQILDMQAITQVANELEIPIGFDLAHAAGNIPMSLHEWNVDFACWCTYKYLNSGPGSIAGCFIHERHATNVDLPRLAGWWGHDEKTRFQMTGDFKPTGTAEGWQLSNPSILSAAAIRASLDIFKSVGGICRLAEKSKQQQIFFRDGIQERLAGLVSPIAPLDQSGCQLSLEIVPEHVHGKQVFEKLEAAGARTDWREPNVIRAAPTPLYNTFEEIWHFVDQLSQLLER